MTTHQVEEIQDVLTDLMFINHGRIVLECSMEEFESRYLGSDGASRASRRSAGAQADSRAPGVRSQRHAVRSVSIAVNSPRSAKCARPSIADLFVAVMGDRDGQVRRRNQMNTAIKRSHPSSDRIAVSASALSATRPFYWSVRRELWENRSIYIAPLIVAGVILFGYAGQCVSLCRERRRDALLLDPAHRRAAIETPYDIAAMMIILTAFIVGFFYCLDALHGERRDRSILFWKSLPVSDLTTVLSKAEHSARWFCRWSPLSSS